MAPVYAMFMRPTAPHGRIASHFFGHPGFQHCEFYFSDRDETFATMQALISLTFENSSRLGRYTAHASDELVWTAVPLDKLDDTAVSRLYSECRELTGRPYNYGGLFTHVLGDLGRIKYPPGSLFCSEALALALHRSDAVDLQEYGFSNAASCRPSDVFRICMELTTADRHVSKSHVFTDRLLGIRGARDRESAILEESNRIIAQSFVK